jgi:hypothetical protein
MDPDLKKPPTIHCTSKLANFFYFFVSSPTAWGLVEARRHRVSLGREVMAESAVILSISISRDSLFRSAVIERVNVGTNIEEGYGEGAWHIPNICLSCLSENKNLWSPEVCGGGEALRSPPQLHRRNCYPQRSLMKVWYCEPCYSLHVSYPLHAHFILAST